MEWCSELLKKSINSSQIYIECPDKYKIVNILLSISFNMCFGCSKELSHWDGSFENPQHMFQLRNKKTHYYALLLWYHYCSRWGVLVSKMLFWTLYLLVWSADNLCKQFAKCQAWSGSKLFDTLMVFLIFFPKMLI